MRDANATDSGNRKRPNGYWASALNVRKAVSRLARLTAKPPQSLTWKDFESHGFSGLLQAYDSIGHALRAIGLKVSPGSRAKNFPGYWEQRGSRIKAVLLVKQKTGKKFHELKRQDFIRCGVSGLLRGNRTIFTVCREAGFVGEPWELGRVSNKHFSDRSNRRRALLWLEKKTGKALHELDKNDFRRHGLSTLLTRARPYGIGSLLRELGEGHDLLRARKSWKTTAQVRRALEHVLRKTGKSRLSQINSDDLRDHGFAGLYQSFGSMAKLLRTVGVQSETRENPFRATGFQWKSGHGHRFKSQVERDFDDVLSATLKLAPNEHGHNVPYIPGRDFSCDFVDRKHNVFFEMAGWFYMTRGGSRRQREYRQHLSSKAALAHKLGRTLVTVIPRKPNEWIFRANRPIRRVFEQLGLLGDRTEERKGRPPRPVAVR